jgi:hypothetical protein
MYSASHEDKAMIPCCLEDQAMAPPPISMMYPQTDFLLGLGGHVGHKPRDHWYRYGITGIHFELFKYGDSVPFLIQLQASPRSPSSNFAA